MTDFSTDGIKYKIINSALRTCSVGSGEPEKLTALEDQSTKFVRIPATVKDSKTSIEYSVTLISDYSFWSSNVETVIIPYTVEKIQHAAFAQSSHLSTFIFEPGSKLKNLGPRFIHFTSVARIVLPPNDKLLINNAAFEYANSLTKIIFCGNIKLSGTFATSNAGIKAYVPMNFKYSTFGGIQIVKTSLCSPFRFVSHCLKRRSMISSILFVVLLICY